jgi:hypothetical protein
MAIKQRPAEGPPPLQMVPDNGDPAPTARTSEVPETAAAKQFASNPKLDARLDAYMKADPKLTEYYTKLVQGNPERAVRKLMLNEMNKHDQNMQYVSKVMPQVKEWLSQQTPEVQQRIQDRIQNVPPIHQEVALVREAKAVKMRMDFAPKPRQAMAASV